MIEVDQLGRTYGARVALADVSFSIDRGRIVGLLGANGAGKTTTLRILTGLLAPTAGRARVCGHDVVTATRDAQRVVGYLAEGAPAYDEMTVRAFLRFVAHARGLGPAEQVRAVGAAAEATSVTDRLDDPIASLSRGYRQRVGLAAALVHDPPVLVLDEPTTGLDPHQVADLRALIRRIGATRTVLLSTHVLSEVEAACDRVLILHHGRLVADDRTEALRRRARGQVVDLALGAGKVLTDAASVQRSLEAVPGVLEVRPSASGDAALRVEVHADRDVRAALYTWAVAHGHLLIELTPKAAGLEDVFRQLTGGTP
ncbi:MAG: ATP-binding cassette domain-containing protein [Myxococcota bacterium]